MKILTQYSFVVVAVGTMLLAAATGILGTLGILRRQSLMGDVVGHAALPGIILSFMLFGQKSSLLLLLGAIASGMLAFSLIQLLGRHPKIEADTAMAVVLSAMFGLGMVLKSYIQGNAAYQKASQAGLSSYIFGQAAYILREDIYIILGVSVMALLLFFVFYKEIKIYVFDPTYAHSVGIRAGFLSALMMLSTMLLIAAGLKAVGTVLISSMLIAPALTALQWSRRYSVVLLIAALSGAAAAGMGTLLSSLYKGFSTGPSIILVMSAFALFSVLASPRGLIRLFILRQKMRRDAK